MGLLKDIGKAILIAQTQRAGFNDGRDGKTRPFQFCEPFPQGTELARAYQKGRDEGEKAAVPHTLNKIIK